MTAREILTYSFTPLSSRAIAAEEEASGGETPARFGGAISAQAKGTLSIGEEEPNATKGDGIAKDARCKPGARRPWEMPRTLALMLSLLAIVRPREPGLLHRNRPPFNEWKLPNGCVLAVRCRSK